MFLNSWYLMNSKKRQRCHFEEHGDETSLVLSRSLVAREMAKPAFCCFFETIGVNFQNDKASLPSPVPVGQPGICFSLEGALLRVFMGERQIVAPRCYPQDKTVVAAGRAGKT